MRKSHYHIFLGISCHACTLSCLPVRHSFPFSSLGFPNSPWGAGGRFLKSWSLKQPLVTQLSAQIGHLPSGIVIVVQPASCPPFTGSPEAMLINPTKQAGLQHFWKLDFFPLSSYLEIESVDLSVIGNSWYCWEKFATCLKLCWSAPKSRRHFYLPSSKTERVPLIVMSCA